MGDVRDDLPSNKVDRVGLSRDLWSGVGSRLPFLAQTRWSLEAIIDMHNSMTVVGSRYS
jgi:hypothetical protein